MAGYDDFSQAYTGGPPPQVGQSIWDAIRRAGLEKPKSEDLGVPSGSPLGIGMNTLAGWGGDIAGVVGNHPAASALTVLAPYAAPTILGAGALGSWATTDPNAHRPAIDSAGAAVDPKAVYARTQAQAGTPRVGGNYSDSHSLGGSFGAPPVDAPEDNSIEAVRKRLGFSWGGDHQRPAINATITDDFGKQATANDSVGGGGYGASAPLSSLPFAQWPESEKKAAFQHAALQKAQLEAADPYQTQAKLAAIDEAAKQGRQTEVEREQRFSGSRADLEKQHNAYLSDLERERPSLTPEAYKAKQAVIENAYQSGLKGQDQAAVLGARLAAGEAWKS